MRRELQKIWSKFSDKDYRHNFLSAWLGDFLAGQIYYLRSQKEWTQGKLSEKSGILQPTISNLEKSCENVSLKTLKKVAAAFDVALIVKFVPFSQFARETQSVILGEAIPSFSKDTIESYVSLKSLGPETLTLGNGLPSRKSKVASSPSLQTQNIQISAKGLVDA